MDYRLCIFISPPIDIRKPSVQHHGFVLSCGIFHETFPRNKSTNFAQEMHVLVFQIKWFWCEVVRGFSGGEKIKANSTNEGGFLFLANGIQILAVCAQKPLLPFKAAYWGFARTARKFISENWNWKGNRVHPFLLIHLSCGKSSLFLRRQKCRTRLDVVI